MKKFSVSLALLAVALVVVATALVFVGCGNGTTDGNSIDTNKLLGIWKNDANSRIIGFTNFNADLTNPQNSMFDCILYGETYSTTYNAELNGNVVKSDDKSFKVAFEGEKLRISESKGAAFSGLDGLYTKQP